MKPLFDDVPDFSRNRFRRPRAVDQRAASRLRRGDFPESRTQAGVKIGVEFLEARLGMNAPVCLAKGVDDLALKIREVASAHSIPVVENPPLARALHATVEVDREIPPEHYKAVAEVIGYVLKLRRRAVPRVFSRL